MATRGWRHAGTQVTAVIAGRAQAGCCRKPASSKERGGSGRGQENRETAPASSELTRVSVVDLCETEMKP